MSDRTLIYGEMPQNMKEISRTNLFTEQTVPAKMRKQHYLTKDTWGLLTVKSGALTFMLEGDSIGIDVKQGQSVVIEPEKMHFVATSGPVSFDVAFFTKVEGVSEDMCCAGPSR